MSLTAFNRARRLKQLNEMKPENIKEYADVNKSEVAESKVSNVKEYVDEVVEADKKSDIDKEKSYDESNTRRRRRYSE